MWLVYLRYDDDAEVRTYHARAGNKSDAYQLLERAKEGGPSDAAQLVEYAVFYSARTIHSKEAPNFHMDPGFLRRPVTSREED